MAPTGPRAAANRGAHRPTRGGGITKRRGPERTDRDGDVPMDAPVGGGGHRGGASGRGPRGSRGRDTRSSRIVQNVKKYVGDQDSLAQGSKAHFNQVILKIHGVRESKAASNPDGGRGSVISFIQRKVLKVKDKPIKITRSAMVGDYLYISVYKDDVPAILHLSGYDHAGAPITIIETDEKMPGDSNASISSHAAETKEKLHALLASRYDPERRLLNLSALGRESIFSEISEESKAQQTLDQLEALAAKTFRALLHLASMQYKTDHEKKEALQAVSIANNDIKDVSQVYQLAKTLPSLKRLDLSGNRLDSLSKISKWKGCFKYLEELHLAGNAVTSQSDYVAELLTWFPSLQNLDGQVVRTPEQAAEHLKSLEPKPIPQFPSNLRDGDNNVASTFLQNFFPLFDTDRARLVSELYDDDSWFSLSAVPDSGRSLPWKSYMRFSRNIHKSGSRANSTMQRLFTGGHLINDLWKALPATRHPTIDQPGQWLVDCHTFPHLADPSGQGFAMGLIIIVQGQFEEADVAANLHGTRTFSRTFVLGPSKPNNPHPFRVISDQLTLHKWTPAPEATPTSAAASQQIAIPVGAGVTSPALPVQVGVPDDALRAQLIQELSNRTGMTAQYSELCLSGSANWNFDAALQNFEEQKSNLPPTAFISTA